MAEKEYIEREAAIKATCDICPLLHNKDLCNGDDCANCYVIRAIPTADVAEVKRGKWKLNKDGSGTCNQCRITQKNVWDYDSWQNYCGHCGAKMDGAQQGNKI